MGDTGNAKQGAELYFEFLAEEGYRPKIDANGNVAFKSDGKSYVIEIDDEDAIFFRLAYPTLWHMSSDEELAQVQEIALAVTREYKVVKICPEADTDTWAAIELFCDPPETFTKLFDRSLRALRGAVKDFVTRMQASPMQQDDAFIFHLPKYTVGANRQTKQWRRGERNVRI
jgi:hypothetical protein